MGSNYNGSIIVLLPCVWNLAVVTLVQNINNRTLEQTYEIVVAESIGPLCGATGGAAGGTGGRELEEYVRSMQIEIGLQTQVVLP